MSVHLYEYNLKMPSSLFPLRKGLILETEVGWGEIAPLPGFNKESFEEVKEELLKILFQKAPFSSSLPSVQFGLASAQTPFLKTALKIPLASLHIPKEKTTTLKLKLGDLSFDEALSLIRKYAKNYRLRLDFNRKWEARKTLELLSFFSLDLFEYVEEPAKNLEDLFYFSKNSPCPIAVDETAEEKEWGKIKTVQVLVVKPTRWGKVPKNSPYKIVLSSSFESSLGILQIARLYKPSFLVSGLDTFSEDLLNPPLKIKEGNLVWEPTDRFPIRKEKLCLISSIS